MFPELAQWITPAAVVAVLLYVHRSLRQDMRELRVEVRELRQHVDSQIGSLRDRMESQNSILRDRLGRIEGYLDLLQQFFIGGGRGTAA